jgi:hypothetical protein
MWKLMKLLVVVAFIGGLFYAGSYAGARATVGKFLGSPYPEMGDRTERFAYDGITDLQNHPRGWEFHYSRVAVNAGRPAKVFVSLDGKILGTVPKDLESRLASWRKSQEPS